MSSFVLKIIAMVTMFCDHFSYIVVKPHTATMWNYIGRIAMYIFCFQIVLGYKKTKNVKKYLLRLLLFSFISQIPYVLYFESFGIIKGFNVDVTLLLGLLSLVILNIRIKNGKIILNDNNELDTNIIHVLVRGVFIALVCGFMVWIEKVTGYKFEYGYFAIIFIIAIYFFYPFDNKSNLLKLIPYIICILLFAFYEAQIWFGQESLSIPLFSDEVGITKYISIYISCIIGGLIPLTYNGKQGKPIKWITYSFYPAHLLLLYFLNLFIS